MLRFEGMIGEDNDLPWDSEDALFVCKAQNLQAKQIRTGFLMGHHPRWEMKPVHPALADVSTQAKMQHD